jgi:hypothetical protein
LSHLPQRKEKNCLNCGTEILGRYCHQCGQENLEPKESFWHLITHFLYDFTHFDGKFFSTLKFLVLKPGYLTAEYMKGRRASYLHPIRMYVFTSAFFFIIFFWMFHVGKIDFRQSIISGKDSLAWLNAKQAALSGADTHEDSMEILQRIEKVKSGISIDSVKKRTSNVGITLDTVLYKTVAEYEAAQSLLPKKDRDNWLKRTISIKVIQIEENYHGDLGAYFRDALNNFLHQFPKMFFISLPIFAFFLKLLYIRRRQFYYADHAIFAVHLYIFSFILLLVFFGVTKLNQLYPSVVWLVVGFILWLYWLYYTYKAMRVFYKQGRAKTIVKYLLLNLASFVIILILFTVFFSYSVLEM